MTKETAKKFNSLREQAMPFTIREKFSEFNGYVSNRGIVTGPHQTARRPNDAVLSLRETMQSALSNAFVQAQAEEIISAAREDRAASHPVVHLCTGEYPCGIFLNNSNNAVLARTWDLALPQITAAVEQQNAQFAAAYQVYRTACEQGIAVPPVVAKEED